MENSVSYKSNRTNRFFGMLDLAYVSILEKSRGSILELCSDAVNRIEYSELWITFTWSVTSESIAHWIWIGSDVLWTLHGSTCNNDNFVLRVLFYSSLWSERERESAWFSLVPGGERIKKRALYLSVNVFSTKVLIHRGHWFLRLLLETRPPFYVVIWAMWRSSHL